MEHNEVKKAARDFVIGNYEPRMFYLKDLHEAFIAGAEWRKEQQTTREHIVSVLISHFKNSELNSKLQEVADDILK